MLVNPAAGRGHAAARAAAVEAALRVVAPVRRVETQGKGDERRIAADACADGATLLAVVGGDGSLHHAARGVLESPTAIPLAVFAAGTGNDFVKSLGTPAHHVEQMIAVIQRGRTQQVDVGVMDGVPFLNAAGMGFDVDVLQRMQHPSPLIAPLRGTAAYVATALQALFRYPGFDAALSANGDAVTRHVMTVFANGRCFGGAFRIAPTASLTDGELDLVDCTNVSPWSRPRLFLRVIRGTHGTAAGVLTRRGAHFTVTCHAPPMFEADGELYAAQSAAVQVGVHARRLSFVTV